MSTAAFVLTVSCTPAQELIMYIYVPDMASYIRGWIQMVLAPNDLFSRNNRYNKYINYNNTDAFTCFFLTMYTTYSVHAGILKDFLPSSHSITSWLYPYLGSTDAPCSRLGVPAPLSPKWRPHSHSLTGIWNKICWWSTVQ